MKGTGRSRAGLATTAARQAAASARRRQEHGVGGGWWWRRGGRRRPASGGDGNRWRRRLAVRGNARLVRSHCGQAPCSVSEGRNLLMRRGSRTKPRGRRIGERGVRRHGAQAPAKSHWPSLDATARSRGSRRPATSWSPGPTVQPRRTGGGDDGRCGDRRGTGSGRPRHDGLTRRAGSPLAVLHAAVTPSARRAPQPANVAVSVRAPSCDATAPPFIAVAGGTGADGRTTT